MEIDTCNRKAAMALVRAFEDREIPDAPSGWVGEDSDYPQLYWRIGGNYAVVQRSWGLEAMRWHEFLRETRHLKYPAI
jgi:hypothetical protein